MKKIYIDILKVVLFISLGVFLMYLVFRQVPLKDLWESLKGANYWWIGLSLILAFVSHLSRGVRWRLLINTMGHNVSTANAFYAVMVGYWANLALPRLGEVLRPGVLNRYDKVPLNTLFGTIVLERTIDLIILFVIIISAIILQFNLLGNFLHDKIFKRFFQSDKLDSTTIVLIICGFILIAIILFILFKKYRNSGLFLKIKAFLKGMAEGFKSIKQLEKKGQFIFYTIVIWVCYFFMTYLCFFSLSFTENLPMIAGLSVLAMGSIGIVAPSPGGMGTYHWLVYQTLILYGITKEEGIIFAGIVHGSQTLFIVVFGFLSYMLLILSGKSRKNEPIRDHST